MTNAAEQLGRARRTLAMRLLRSGSPIAPFAAWRACAHPGLRATRQDIAGLDARWRSGNAEDSALQRHVDVPTAEQVESLPQIRSGERLVQR
jgi:hypothetical protein